MKFLSFFSNIALLAVFVSGTTAGLRGLQVAGQQLKEVSDPKAEVQYLPSGKGLNFISLGYSNALGTLLWFNTISYFGKHYKSDKDYRWLQHMCGLVSDLNPKEKAVYEFCSLMLAWELEKPDAAISILDKGIAANPEYWKFFYLRGFNKLYFLEEEKEAQEDFVKAAGLPDADTFVVNIASRLIANSDSAQAAVSFLENMLSKPMHETERKAIEHRLAVAVNDLNLIRLEKAVAAFAERVGHKPSSYIELYAADLIPYPQWNDPFGKPYKIKPETGEPYSESNTKRLSKTRKESPKAAKHISL